VPEVAPFNADETRRLERFPFYVFFLVAGADGVVDGKEFEGFVHRLIDFGSEAGMEGSGPDAELLANSGRYFESLHAEVKKAVKDGGEDAVFAGLTDGIALLDARLDVSAAQAFKKRMLHLGETVAEASGGFMGVGSVSRFERAALKWLTKALGPIG